MDKSAEEILGNPDYLAISYGGYRQNTRDIQPTVDELKEDMLILKAMGVGMLRTYNTHFEQAGNILQAIRELKNEDPQFEMYVMLGIWINCENAFTGVPNHDNQDIISNTAEVDRAVELAKTYPDIVKVLAVGNEAMVKWAASYFVQPGVILGWVKYLQDLKVQGVLDRNLWITSSDNFASWGGGGQEYHVDALNQLWEAVDYVSMHTYPMHDTHYNPSFWGMLPDEQVQEKKVKIEVAMERALSYAQAQYDSVVAYGKHIGVNKPIHIGETGWATSSNGFYGETGSKATDEYKEGLYHRMMREWTNKNNISCFFFEAFDENWKDALNPGGSENHFGLITIDGTVKYALWDLVDQGAFEGISRGGNPLKKSWGGNLDSLLSNTEVPPLNERID
ncbi:glycosyl hydrolase family 17 [Aureicoccus marinus]|uniref:Endo-1,3-beta-glucanase btgC n=2 Tax=Aureicoccus marinus TaxID=754435 RepID=A0A2S7T482_9FLAO|nr:glycosyl hydrolase family 17 [Aureicoccus marinus]